MERPRLNWSATRASSSPAGASSSSAAIARAVRRARPAAEALARRRATSGSWLMKASMRFWRCQLRKIAEPQTPIAAAMGPKKGARAAAAISHSATTTAATYVKNSPAVRSSPVAESRRWMVRPRRVWRRRRSTAAKRRARPAALRSGPPERRSTRAWRWARPDAYVCTPATASVPHRTVAPRASRAGLFMARSSQSGRSWWWGLSEWRSSDGLPRLEYVDGLGHAEGGR